MNLNMQGWKKPWFCKRIQPELLYWLFIELNPFLKPYLMHFGVSIKLKQQC